MSEITYELKISFEGYNKDQVLNELVKNGRNDWVDSYDELDIDDEGSEAVISEILETETLSVSLYSYDREELETLKRSLSDKFPKIKIILKEFSSIVWNEAWEESYESYETEYFLSPHQMSKIRQIKFG